MNPLDRIGFAIERVFGRSVDTPQRIQTFPRVAPRPLAAGGVVKRTWGDFTNGATVSDALDAFNEGGIVPSLTITYPADYVPAEAAANEAGPVDDLVEGESNEASPGKVTIAEGRHHVGFAEHLASVNDAEHAMTAAFEAQRRVFELELLLERWRLVHLGEYSPAGDSALIPDTMRALGAVRPRFTGGAWVDGDES